MVSPASLITWWSFSRTNSSFESTWSYSLRGRLSRILLAIAFPSPSIGAFVAATETDGLFTITAPCQCQRKRCLISQGTVTLTGRGGGVLEETPQHYSLSAPLERNS